MQHNSFNGNALHLYETAQVGVIRKDGSHFIPGLEPEVEGFQPYGWVNVFVGEKGRAAKASYQFRNLVVAQGKQSILSVYFSDAAQIASANWSLGLIGNTGFTSIQSTDTAASHPGWTEFVGYSQTARPAWGQAAPATGVTTITNPSPATFDITSADTLRGVFVVSASGKNATTGTLWAAAQFTTPVPVANGDQVRVSYSVAS